MRSFIIGAIIAPLVVYNGKAANTKILKVYKAFDGVEILPLIYNKPVNERLHILCGALAAYREAQGEDFPTKKLEADVAFFSAKKQHISACHEITRKGRYPWASYSIDYIKPKNMTAWKESQWAALEEKENPKPVEYVCNKSVYKHTAKKRVYKKTKTLVFYNYKE